MMPCKLLRFAGPSPACQPEQCNHLWQGKAMPKNERVINELDGALIAEPTVIVQYMVQAEMCDAWGYKRLAATSKTRAIEEMRHAEGLIGGTRQLFLKMIHDEEHHADYLEAQLGLISKLGIQDYLSEQLQGK
jgi:bacterioferritin (cytochrome b1)